MERIVVGFDGSAAAVSALAWIAARADVVTLRVDVVCNLDASTGDDVALSQLATAEAYLRDRVPFVAVDLHRLSGAIASTLATVAESADLLVVGAHLGHPVRAMLAGATPFRVSVRSSIPTAIVPEGWTMTRDPVTVGVAADDSSQAALLFAANQAEIYGVPLRLVHVWGMPIPDVTSETTIEWGADETRSAHQEILNRAVTSVAGAYPQLDVTSRLISGGRAKALLRQDSISSLLVIGTHRQGLLAGLLWGAVAQGLLWRSRSAVVIVPNGATPQMGAS